MRPKLTLSQVLFLGVLFVVGVGVCLTCLGLSVVFIGAATDPCGSGSACTSAAGILSLVALVVFLGLPVPCLIAAIFRRPFWAKLTAMLVLDISPILLTAVLLLLAGALIH